MALANVGSSLLRQGRRASGRVGSMAPRGAALPLAAAAAGTVGFFRGVGEADISSATYEFATGDPEIDRYIFGTDIGIQSLMTPFPLQRLGAEMRMINPTTLSRYNATRTKSQYFNPTPEVSGDMVFGMYNSRLR